MTTGDRAAHNAAYDADFLAHDPTHPYSMAVMMREGESPLAQEMVEAEIRWREAHGAVDFLVLQRPQAETLDEMLGDGPRDARLEELISAAKQIRDRRWALREEVVQKIAALANNLVDRTPGAAGADLGFV